MTRALPKGPGVAVFAGGGMWLPRSDHTAPDEGSLPMDAAVVLREPVRTIVAHRPEEISALLDEVEHQQSTGRYVAGYLAYEAGAAFGLTVKDSASDALPLAWMAAYDKDCVTVIPEREWADMLAQVDVDGVATALSGVRPKLSVSRDDYVAAIARVRNYIAAGDTYQVNYTVRGRFWLKPAGDTPGDAGRPGIDPLDYFLALVVRQPVPYAAYLDLGDAQVISLSPELFLRREGRRIESRPMKGTRPRGKSHGDDVALAYELAETEKERAENLMIVDMVRNDLGRVCRAGSIRVPTLYAVEPYRTVWQMVSTVVGDVNPQATLSEIMQAVFPGASITGAPKHHTMEIIAELETEPRDVYTGTVSLFVPGRDFTANIGIRTIIHRQGRCQLGIGSGVVWDADAGAEYQETLDKAAFATPPLTGGGPRRGPWRPDAASALRQATETQKDLHLFETLLLEATPEGTSSPSDPLAREDPRIPGDTPTPRDPRMPDDTGTPDDQDVLARYRFLQGHLDRMSASARALGLPFATIQAREMLSSLAQAHPETVVVRIQLDASGQLTVSTREAPGSPLGAVKLLVSPFRTDSADPFLAHKTSLRGLYDREHPRAAQAGCFDALFLNRLDHVTEGAITNLFARFGDEWITPPLQDGLLPGVWRSWFLEQTSARELSLTLSRLTEADEIVVGNSVRGAVRVEGMLVQPLTS